MGMCGGGGAKVAAPTAEETALNKKQLEIINRQESVASKQEKEQEALAPYLYSQMGLKRVSTVDTGKIQSLQKELLGLNAARAARPGAVAPVTTGRGGQIARGTAAVNPAYSQEDARVQAITKEMEQLRGNPNISLTAMSDDEKRALMSPEERETSDIRSLANQRTKKALEGNLDVDPSVEADIQRGTSQLRTELLRKLGPGAEGSDSWNRAFSEYDRNMNAVRYSVRHGEMTTADALATNRSTEAMRRQDQAMQHLKGATDPYSTNASTYGGSGTQIGGALDQYYGKRVDAADLSMQNSSNRNAFGGQLIGAGLGAAGMATALIM